MPTVKYRDPTDGTYKRLKHVKATGMSVEIESAKQLAALKSSIEAKTGETYANLTEGVQALLDAYGNSGDNTDVTTAILGTAKLSKMKLG